MFPSSVTSIESKSFLGAVNLTGVVLSESIGTIPSYAFQNCINLKTVHNYSNIKIFKGDTNNGYVGYYATSIINYN